MVFEISQASRPWDGKQPAKHHPKAVHAFIKDDFGNEEVHWFVELETLEELFAFSCEIRHPLIIQRPFIDGSRIGDNIIIYDDMIE